MNLISIIVNWNTGKILLDLLNDLHQQKGNFTQTIVMVDNNSDDDIVKEVEEKFPSVTVILNKKNVGFAAAVNQVLRRYPDAAYYLLINPDVRLPTDALQHLVSFSGSDPKIGIAGCHIIDKDGNIVTKYSTPNVIRNILTEIKYYWFGWTDLRKSRSKPRDHNHYVKYVSGSFFLIRGQVVKDIGLLDERFWAFFEESDYCRRAIVNRWKVGLDTSLFVRHFYDTSFKQRPFFRRQIWNQSAYRFFKKYNLYRAAIFHISIITIWSIEYLVKFLFRLPQGKDKINSLMEEYFLLIKSIKK